jgi:hypothetical protein
VSARKQATPGQPPVAIESEIRYNPTDGVESDMRAGNTFRNLKLPKSAGGSKFGKALAGSGASGKKIARILVWALVVLMVAAGLLYIQASRVPGNYRPAKLSPEETKKAVDGFVRDVAQGFGNKVKMVEPFEWSITQSTLNRYLASIDEIAFSLPNGVKRGQIDAEMAKLGLAGPAAALEDGKVTLMVRSTAYRKVLSAEISVELVDGKLRFTLSATRIGKLPMPSGFLTGKIRAMSAKLTGERSDDIAETLAELLSAIDGEPISPPDTWRIQGVKVSIEAITIANGKLTLKVRPIPPKRK